MNPPENKDQLDALLRIDALLREQNPHVDDAGFTARVVSALPRRHARFRLRPVLLLGAAAVGSALAAFWLPWASLPTLSLPALLSLNSQILWPWTMVLLVVASLTWAVVAAIQPED
jgi:hypothetical protein